MKLLITGAGGQLGKEWVQYCEINSIPYEAYDSKGLDISQREKVENTLTDVKPDALINCAAYTKVDQAEDEKILATKINARAVKDLAEVCREHRVKLVHFSTDYVFSGAEEDKYKFPEGYPETHQTDPVNVYGATKLEGEKAIQYSGCDFLIIRVAWLCGQFGHNFVKTMLRLGAERDQLNVVNDQSGCPTFADQVVEQSVALLEALQSGIYHLSSKGVITWYDFACEIFKIAGIDVEVNPVSSSEFKTKATRPAFSKLSTHKIEQIPGIEIRDWKQNLNHLIRQIS